MVTAELLIPTVPMGRKRGRPRLSEAVLEEERHQQIKSRVLTLRQKKLSRKEIAKSCQLGEGIISSCIGELIKEKKIKSEQGRRGERETWWRNLQHERTQLVVKLCKQRRTLEEIGSALNGVTRERARQLIENISTTHGAQIFEPATAEEALWTPKEVAEAIGTSSSIVLKICRQGEVPYILRSSSLSQNKLYLLTLEGVEALCLHSLITKKVSCALITCNKKFTRMFNQSHKKYCSDPCYEQARKNWRITISQSSPNSSDSLRKWHKLLYEQLQQHIIPDNDEWITITKAAIYTRLSHVQLWWLAYRKIITIKKHSTKIAPSNGKPVMLYSVSEMEIVKQVFQNWKK